MAYQGHGMDEDMEEPDEDFDDTSIFENKSGLAEDMRFLASMPELCDVTFLVGDTREPVCAVKAVLAARSRVFHKLLWHTGSAAQTKKKEAPKNESKFRAFIKRSSEPLLTMQGPQQPPNSQHQTLIIEEFEPDVFRQLIEYIHTGCVTLQPRTLLGTDTCFCLQVCLAGDTVVIVLLLQES